MKKTESRKIVHSSITRLKALSNVAALLLSDPKTKTLHFTGEDAVVTLKRFNFEPTHYGVIHHNAENPFLDFTDLPVLYFQGKGSFTDDVLSDPEIPALFITGWKNDQEQTYIFYRE